MLFRLRYLVWFCSVRIDHVLYRLVVYPTMCRMIKRNPGYAFLWLAWLTAWCKDHPLTPEQQLRTDVFCATHLEQRTWP